MRKLTYLAVLEPLTGGGYGVYFPDFPGCASWGRTVEETVAIATEVLGFHIYGMEQDGETIPEPATELRDNDQVTGCIVTLVTIFPDIVKNEKDNKRVKVNVTLPNWLKQMAEGKKVNYSNLLEATLIDYLGIK